MTYLVPYSGLLHIEYLRYSIHPTRERFMKTIDSCYLAQYLLVEFTATL